MLRKMPVKREFRSDIRLARYLDNDALRTELVADVESGEQPGARQAAWILRELL